MTHRQFSRSLIGLGFGAVFLFALAVFLPWWAFALTLLWLLVAVCVLLLFQGGASWDREAHERLARWNRIEGE